MQNAKKIIHCKLNEHNIYMLKNKEKRFIMDLKYEKKDIYSKLNEEEIKNVYSYVDEYLEFLNKGKTEYLCVEEATKLLNKSGFVDINEKENLQKGDKVYFINKSKSLYVAVIGEKDLESGMNIIGAHIDSPRLDLKPMPLCQKHGMALFKTQYYGGIKKYQWMSIPLALHGICYNEKGEKKVISIGEENDDICFTIADLLPHLAKDQLKANGAEFIDPEKMLAIVASTKIDGNRDSAIKDMAIKILNEKYDIKEIDFARSELSFVPAWRAKYVGIDKSMVGGYGQDDRVCSYATIKAISEIDSVEKTAVAMIVDKEEIGSIGNTSMNSQIFDMFVNRLIKKTGTKADILEVYYNSKMLSADVSTCVDPNYDEVSDIQNGNILGCGIALEKYTGSGGKYNSSDANAEFVSQIMSLFEKNNVDFQIGTLGKIGKGGGGTIAYILANKGVDVIDCGTPVLAMHSPFEVASIYDIYATYLAYKTMFRGK